MGEARLDAVDQRHQGQEDGRAGERPGVGMQADGADQVVGPPRGLLGRRLVTGVPDPGIALDPAVIERGEPAQTSPCGLMLARLR